MTSFSKILHSVIDDQFNNLEHQDQFSDPSNLFLLDSETEERSSYRKRRRLSASRDISESFCLPSAASLFTAEHLCESGAQLADNSFFTDLLLDTDPTTDDFDSPNLSDYLPNLTLPAEQSTNSSTLLFSQHEPTPSDSDHTNLFSQEIFLKTEEKELQTHCKEETEVVDGAKSISESGSSEVGNKKVNTKKTITPHRLIEKRRRDRINQSLQELKSLVLPPAKAKSKLDKADILRLAIDHIKMLHEQNKENSAENQLKRKMLKEESVEPTEHQSQSLQEAKPSTQAYVGQHIMLGYMDCHQEAIDFLIQQASLPEDHPIIKQLNSHLLKQQQNLDLSAMERNLQLAQELRNVAELNSSTQNPTEDQIATQLPANTCSGDFVASLTSTSSVVTSSKIMSSTPKRAKREPQAFFSVPNIPEVSYQSCQPIAETYLSSSHLNSGISSASVQSSSNVTKLLKENKVQDSLPSFPIFAMPYISSPKQQIVEQAKPSIYSINCK